MKITNADQMNGCFLRVDYDNWVFRVYDKDYNIKDYEVLHSDLCATINDTDAYFYEREDGRLVLDHGPETLGETSGAVSDAEIWEAWKIYFPNEAPQHVIEFARTILEKASQK